MDGPDAKPARRDRVVRSGSTVRRPAGYWTPAVHALLRHLERVGFGAPRVVGVEGDVEILSFVEGEVPQRPTLPGWADDAVLASVGTLLRRYHDAVASFQPPASARWQPTSIPTTGSLVCHNDLYPGNVVFPDRRAVIGELTRRMRDKRVAEGYPTSLLDNSLAAQQRHREALLNALE